jgi:hypothetical protein
VRRRNVFLDRLRDEGVREQARRCAGRAQTAALDSERAARTAGDEANKAEIASLRNDLQALRTEFGAKIQEIAGAIQFAFPVHFAFNDANRSHRRRRRARSLRERRLEALRWRQGDGGRFRRSRRQPALQHRALAASRRGREGYVSSKGLDASLIETVGYGESRQVTRGASGDQPGAELNRRVVFVIESPANAQASKVTASLEQQ